MATLGELNIKIAANVAQLSQDVTKVEREMRKMRQAGLKTSKQLDAAAKGISGFKKLAVGVASVTAAWRVMTSVVGSSLQAFQAQEDAETKLAAALGETNQGLLDQAAALQKVTRFGDETIIEAQALIAAFVKDEEQIKLATKATLDLAAAKGMDLKAAADLVAKSLGSSTNALSRYGIEVKGAVGSTERLDSAVKNIGARFGGQAQAQADTMAGRIEQMNNAWGDMQETLVGLVAPALTNFAEKMVPIINQISEFIEGIRKSREEALELQGQFGEGGLFGFDEGDEEPEQITQARQRRAARESEITRALEEANQRLLDEQKSEARARELQAEREHNQMLIEEGQSQWELELNIEQDRDRVKEQLHQKELARSKESIDAKMKERRAALSAASGILSSLGTIASASNASFRTQKRIAAAQGIVDSIGAALNAFRSTPYPLNFVTAGLTLAAGLAQVSNMKSVGPGGGSAGGFGAAPVVSAPNTQDLLDMAREEGRVGGTETTIVFQGGTFIGGDKDAFARDITPSIEKALSDGAG